MSYPLEDALNPRAFVYASNEEAMVFQSARAETRLRFYNNQAPAGYVLSASNASFVISRDLTTPIAAFSVDGGRALVTVPGKVSANRFEVISKNDRKSVVLADFNANSSNQFAGFGYIGGQLQYQVPSDANIHRFMVGADAYTSYEIMRMQRSAQGVAQVGIGTSAIPSASTSLHVAGNVVVDGALTFDDRKYVQLDTTTGRLRQTQLPEKTVLLNSNNQVDESMLPQQFNFQYLRAQKNVGIGTKTPLQKLHVNGSCFVTQRTGINVPTPAARLHAMESSSPTPTMIVEHAIQGGTCIRTFSSSNLVLNVSDGVGIGTTYLFGDAMRVQGNATFMGDIHASTAFIDRLVIPNVLIQEPVINNNMPEYILRTMSPQVFESRVTMNTILSPLSEVKFENSGLFVEGNILLTGQVNTLSDARFKTEIRRIDDALQKLDTIGGYTYQSLARGAGGQRAAGVLAQEVLDVLPEAVHKVADEDMYTVSYQGLIALLVESVKQIRQDVIAIKHHIGMC